MVFWGEKIFKWPWRLRRVVFVFQNPSGADLLLRPVNDGRCLVMPRYSEPAPEQQLLLIKLGLELPQQPPPKSYADAKAAQATHGEEPSH